MAIVRAFVQAQPAPSRTTMPLYHFVIGTDGLPENLSVELPDIHAAWQQATRAAGEIVRDLDGSFQIGTSWSMQVQDAEHKPLRTIRVISEKHD
jgi:hypothetical protein